MQISVLKICAILRFEGLSRFLLRCALLITFLTQSIEACKLWAVCTSSGITFSNLSQESSSMIQSELNSFYHQSAMMLDGWSILGYQDSSHQETISICRSPNTAPNDSSLYWGTVENLMSNERGVIGMGHLRVATSGSNSIPNPHPWIFQNEGTVFSLMHNGTVNKDLLLNLITDSGVDSSWLEAYPPQTFGGGHWSDSGWESVVDSELILLHVMKKINLLGDNIEGFKAAVSDLVNSGVNAGQLNLIFSDGNSLLVFGGASGLFVSEHSEFTAIMTQPTDDQYHDWQGIANEELIYIDPDTLLRYRNFIINDLDDNPEIPPTKFQISKAYPNPFNSSVNFKLNGYSYAKVSISIYSIMGTMVDQFYVLAPFSDGQIVRWNPDSRLASGTYFVNVVMGTFQETQKILFIK